MRIQGLTVSAGVVLLAVAALGGEPGAETLLPVHAGRDAYKPCVAFGKTAFLVAWQSGRTAPGDLTEGLKFNGDIVGCRVGRDGRILDARPFVVCEAPDLQEEPRSAYGGGVFLVVWQDLRNGKDWDVYAARVSADGKALDKDGFLVSGGAHNQALPRVAWDGKTFLVAWQDFRSGERYEVFCARVSADGKVFEPDGIPVVSLKRASCYTPAVTSSGKGRSLVYWVSKSVSGSSLVSEGKPVQAYTLPKKERRDSTGIGPSGRCNPVSLATGDGGKIHVAVWTNRLPGGRGSFGAGNRACNAAFFDESGRKRIKTFNIGGANRQVVNPGVCWDGTAFVAAWHDPVKTPRGQSGWYDAVFFSRFSPSGDLLGKAGLLSGTMAAPAMLAVLASDGKGTTLVAYERHPSKKEMPITIGFRMLRAK